MFVFSASTYEFLKKLVQIILPATSALYFGLASIWNLPDPEKVVGTIALITTFLGVCLGISSKTYTSLEIPPSGDLVVKEGEGGRKIFSLEIDADPEQLITQSSVTFKIKKG